MNGGKYVEDISIESLLNKINLNELFIDNDHYQYNGINIPRVTEILSSMLHENYLMTWANSLGLYKRRKYKDELDQAAMKGTYVHNAIEDYIQHGNDLDLDTVMLSYQREVSYAYGSFKEWWDIICKRNAKVIMEEQRLVCPWFGGTLDLLIEINNKIYLLDFKTSNHPSYKYFLQLSAYRYILRNYYGIEIYGCGIIKLNKQCIKFEEFIIDKSNPDYENFINICENTFLSLVYAYINRIEVERFYETLF